LQIQVKVRDGGGDRNRDLIKEYVTVGSDACVENAGVCRKMGDADMERFWNVVDRIMEDGWEEDFVEDTLVDLLEEIGDSGDVVGLVTICEVVGVMGRKGVVKKIGLPRVREWYLSYLSLLRSLCMNTKATEMIKRCPDPVISR